MEENKLTAGEFLKSLKEIWWRIKKDNQWYELRVAKSIYDLPFVDQNGELFGVKNAKINFYVFKSGSEEIPDWVQDYLKELYVVCNWDNLPDDEIEPTFCASYADVFIQGLLGREEYLVLTPEGNKPEKWDPNTVY